MTYPHSRMLFSNEQEQSIEPCYNIDDPQTYFAKLQKPNTKDSYMYDSTCVKFPE